MNDKLIVAHRGASAYARDNSVDSFQKAIDMGADMIEFDVRRTGDGILIARHDGIIGGRYIDRTAYDEIKQVDGDIPTYEEVLKLTRGRIKLDIELKERGYEKASADLALKYFSVDDFIMTSFKSKCLKTMHKFYPQIKLGLILGRHQIARASIPMIWSGLPARWARDAGADYLVINEHLSSKKVLKSTKDAGISVMVWTVNETCNMKRFLSSNAVCGIITNHPDTAVELARA